MTILMNYYMTWVSDTEGMAVLLHKVHAPTEGKRARDE
jgi:hypothetical protein